MKVFQGKRRKLVKEAVLHCLAVPTGWAVGKTANQVQAIVREWHTERGFFDIGYHFLVMPDGTFIEGRPLNIIGAHTIGKNTGTFGIAMVESYKVDKIAPFHQYFTEAQRLTVRDLLAKYEIQSVSGHNDHAAKLCPGFKVRSSAFPLI